MFEVERLLILENIRAATSTKLNKAASAESVLPAQLQNTNAKGESVAAEDDDAEPQFKSSIPKEILENPYYALILDSYNSSKPSQFN